MKVQLAKIVSFIVVITIANYFSKGAYFTCQGIMIIALWGTWLANDKTKQFSKWNDFLNYIGLMSIITGISQLIKEFL